MVLRQPKRKETILSPCWGSLVDPFVYRAKPQPAILVEAVNVEEAIVVKASDASLLYHRELKQLEREGHEIEITKRTVRIHSTLESARRTQLYRTVPHEVGHYVFNKIHCGEHYNALEKEMFADSYARKIRDLMAGTDR